MKNMGRTPSMIHVAMAIALLLSASAFSQDLFPPSWRGGIRTTYQDWTFDDADNPADPEIIVNPYGTATAYTTVKPPPGDEGWQASLLDRTGVWPDLESIILELDNHSDPLGTKEVRIQVSYYSPPSDVPLINIPGGVEVSSDTHLVETIGPGGWFVDSHVWVIDPNPDSEIIEITSGSFGITIDQIVVDTACFPEKPAITDVSRNSSGSLEIAWTSYTGCTYAVEVSEDGYDYDESNMTWIYQSTGIPGNAGTTTWEDSLTPTTGQKFYRIYAEGPENVRADDTVGVIAVNVYDGRNMISTPFEPYPEGGGTPGASTLDKIIGDQLIGHPVVRTLSDFIQKWNADTQTWSKAWYKTGVGWQDWDVPGPPMPFLADEGYWIYRNVHPNTAVKLFGRVSSADRSVSVLLGRNLLGTCFPVSVPLDDSGLIESGFTGHPVVKTLSDQVQFWFPTTLNWRTFWYKTGVGFQPWNDGEPMKPFSPGDGFHILRHGSVGFTWNYPHP